MVNIVIMRHGEAEPQAIEDSLRQLTTRGKQESLLMAQWLTRYYSGFTGLWVSPYLRTRQTAELVLPLLGSACQLEILNDLTPDGSAGEVRDYIDIRLSMAPDTKILLVSHMPMVSFLVETLTRSGQTPVFDTAGIFCLDYTPGTSSRIADNMSPRELTLLTN